MMTFFTSCFFAPLGDDAELMLKGVYVQVLGIGTDTPADHKFHTAPRIHKWTILHYSPFKVGMPIN